METNLYIFFKVIYKLMRNWFCKKFYDKTDLKILENTIYNIICISPQLLSISCPSSHNSEVYSFTIQRSSHIIEKILCYI